MPRRDAFQAGLYGALGVAVLALGLFLGYRLLEAMVAISTPFVAALVMALLFDPLVDRFQRQVRFTKRKRGRAVALVYLLFLLAFVALVLLVVPNLVEQVQRLIEWLSTGGLESLRKSVNTWLGGHRRLGPVALPPSVEAIGTQYSDQLTQAVKVSSGRLAQVIVGSVSGLLSVILVPIITFYLLMDLDRLRARFIFLLPDKVRGPFQGVAADVGTVFGNYLRGMVQVSLIYMVVATLALFVASFFFPPLRSYVLLIGVTGGLLYIVPYVGFLGVALVASGVVLATGTGMVALGVCLGVLFVLNQTFDNVVTPRVVGGGVGLHPLLAMFALLLGASLFGLWGMLLAVPAAGSLQVVLFRLYPRLAEPTAPLLAPRPTTPEPEPTAPDEAQ